jgi:Fe-S-cluster containining protein
VKPSLTDQLCTRCGLCCDGSLFADVELAGREATAMEILGLDVEADDPDGMVMSQPCLALKGQRCSIYEHRPQCCRTFECRLLQNVRRGAESVQSAAERIADTRANIAKVTELVAQLGPSDRRLPLVERVAEALASECDSDPRGRTRAELRTAMSALQGSIRETFLHGRRGTRMSRASSR